MLRTLLATPTKKGKLAKFVVPEGEIESEGSLGRITYRPVAERVARVRVEGRDSFNLPLEPEAIPERRVLCRFLLKMAIEIIALEPEIDVFAPELDAARQFARAYRPGTSWWYAQGIDGPSAYRWMTAEPTEEDISGYIHLKLITSPQGTRVFWLQIAFADFLVPIVDVEPDPEIEEYFRLRRV